MTVWALQGGGAHRQQHRSVPRSLCILAAGSLLVFFSSATTAFCWTCGDAACAFSSATRPRLRPQERQGSWGLRPFDAAAKPRQEQPVLAPRLGKTLLRDGYGVATNYSWKEDDFEVEISVRVPANTTASQVKFRAMTKSIDLRLCSGDEEIVLLDGSRPMRGMIQADATFWTFSDDVVDDGDAVEEEHVQIVVTMEKLLKNRMDSMEVHQSEWKGIYRVEDAQEVLERHYEAAPELDIREYASSLGVDIDNIDMSKVDKTMFASQMNMTRSTFDALRNAGMVQEVTQQGSQEFLQDEYGNAVPRSPPGNAWLANSLPVEEVVDRDALVEASGAPKRRKPSIDSINVLTVARLKELLREEGLKVSGKKRELQDRLRQHWQSQASQQEEEAEGAMGAWE